MCGVLFLLDRINPGGIGDKTRFHGARRIDRMGGASRPRACGPECWSVGLPWCDLTLKRCCGYGRRRTQDFRTQQSRSGPGPALARPNLEALLRIWKQLNTGLPNTAIQVWARE